MCPSHLENFTIYREHLQECMLLSSLYGVKVRRVKKLLGAQMEAVVAGTWAVAVLRLPMALLLLAMSTLATSRVPGTRPFRPDPALLLLLWTESGATASQKHERLRIYPWPTTSTRFPHLSAVQSKQQLSTRPCWASVTLGVVVPVTACSQGHCT